MMTSDVDNANLVLCHGGLQETNRILTLNDALFQEAYT
jgi:hypothetical protein